jgi:hypothetical protein
MTVMQQIEIERLTRALDDRQVHDMIKPFATKLGEAIAFMLATTPYDQWPAIGKLAFAHLQPQMPSAAQLYRSRLP